MKQMTVYEAEQRVDNSILWRWSDEKLPAINGHEFLEWDMLPQTPCGGQNEREIFGMREVMSVQRQNMMGDGPEEGLGKLTEVTHIVPLQQVAATDNTKINKKSSKHSRNRDKMIPSDSKKTRRKKQFGKKAQRVNGKKRKRCYPKDAAAGKCTRRKRKRQPSRNGCVFPGGNCTDVISSSVTAIDINLSLPTDIEKSENEKGQEKLEKGNLRELWVRI